MNSPQKNVAIIKQLGDRASSWRSSLYEEPLWVSIAWIVGPVTLAGIAIFYAVT